MPNKTIYVSESDAKLFEEAKEIAGEALSSVISTALREYVGRRQKKSDGMKDISLMVGKADTEREKRFIGYRVGKWSGFSDDKEWWMEASMYRTQKDNWVVYLATVCKATLLTNKNAWKANGDYLTNHRQSELFIGAEAKDFKQKIPQELCETLINLMEKEEKPIEYLDI
jgi:EXLDI family protein